MFVRMQDDASGARSATSPRPNIEAIVIEDPHRLPLRGVFRQVQSVHLDERFDRSPKRAGVIENTDAEAAGADHLQKLFGGIAKHYS